MQNADFHQFPAHQNLRGILESVGHFPNCLQERLPRWLCIINHLVFQVTQSPLCCSKFLILIMHHFQLFISFFIHLFQITSDQTMLALFIYLFVYLGYACVHGCVCVRVFVCHFVLFCISFPSTYSPGATPRPGSWPDPWTISRVLWESRVML